MTATSVAEALRGKRILLTGATGFIGTALVERVLGSLPETRLVLLIRGRGSRSAARRARDLLDEHAFQPLRERWGIAELVRQFEQRVDVLEGDVAADRLALPEHLAAVDVVVHCAADVAFDRAVDLAFATNVVGCERLYAAIAGRGARPHLVHVSTAYVAGLRRGPIVEGPTRVDVDWRAEAIAVASLRGAAEVESRQPAVLERLSHEARRTLGASNPIGVARAVEGARQEWVTRRLSEIGRARARSLGFPDVYSFTKALGEQIVQSIAREHDLPLSVVRPAITESALEVPYPGWLKGFKMAEPIIHAYSRGDLPESPAVPDGALDIMPIDLVVNALLVVCARPPELSLGPAYYHLVSGARNPLRFRDLYAIGRAYFGEHPISEAGQPPVRPATWTFPGPAAVERRLRFAERAFDLADSALDALPFASAATRRLADVTETHRRRLQTGRRLFDLFGTYVSAEMTYLDHNTRALLDSLSPEDRRDFDFDCLRVDWRRYLVDVHLPAVRRDVHHRRPTPPTHHPPLAARPTLAVFDLDGTLLRTTVLEEYLRARLRDAPRQRRIHEIVRLAAHLPGYVAAEHVDRSQFLRLFYRQYGGASRARLEQLVDEDLAPSIWQRLSPVGLRRIRQHRDAGHDTVLLTGALDVFTRPLAPLFTHVQAARLACVDGIFTGDMDAPPLVGEARLAWLTTFATERAVDLGDVYVYADSHSDLPLLSGVGHPVAINPDVRLYRVARRRRWPVEDWSTPTARRARGG